MSSKKENMARLCMAIIDVFTKILQDILEINFPAIEGQLYNFVCSQKVGLREDQKQLVRLSKSSGYSAFDITLLYTLLRNLRTSFDPPTDGWGFNTLPLPTEKTVGDDIERIRLIRNNILAHSTSTFIMDAEFEKYWREISDVCKRLETYTGRHYVKQLSDIRTSTLDEKLRQECLTKLKTMEKDIDQIWARMKCILDAKRGLQTEAEKTDTQIEVKAAPRSHKLLEVACDIFNAVIDTIDENTSDEKIIQVLEKLLFSVKPLQDQEIEPCILEFLDNVRSKMKTHMHHEKSIPVLLRYSEVSVKLIQTFDGIFSCSNGSLIFKFTFSSTKSQDKFRSYLKNSKLQNIFHGALCNSLFLSMHDKTIKDITLYTRELPDDSNRGEYIILFVRLPTGHRERIRVGKHEPLTEVFKAVHEDFGIFSKSLRCGSGSYWYEDETPIEKLGFKDFMELFFLLRNRGGGISPSEEELKKKQKEEEEISDMAWSYEF